MDLFSDIEESTLPFSIPADIEMSVRWMEDIKAFLVKIPNGELVFAERFFPQKISDRSLEYCLETEPSNADPSELLVQTPEVHKKAHFKNIAWKQDSISLFGKDVPLPRLTSWHGDQGSDYSYSGISSRPSPWNKGLEFLKKRIEPVAGVDFNSVLLNWYRSGEDHLSWHADDEAELGQDPIIASVNFGETRDFVLRRNDDHHSKIKIPLSHGSLLVMRGQLQHHWQHCVPKRKKVAGSRINLTFRRIFV